MNINGKEIAEAIAVYCEAKGIQKYRFYYGAQISSGSVSQWRTGKHAPSLKNIRTIEDYVKMPIEQFLVAYKKRPTTVLGDGQDPELQELKELWEAADPAFRQAALALLRAHAQQAEAQGKGGKA